MKLKTTEYKTIEVAEDEEYGLVVGNIIMDGDKMLYAEIVDGTMCNHEELVNVRTFLDKVEVAMKIGTVRNVLNMRSEIERLPDNLWSIVLQKNATIEEYKEAIRLERIDHAAEKAAIKLKHSEEIRQKDTIIDGLKDQNIKNLHELYDIYEAEIFAIKAVRKTAIILSKEVINKLEAELKNIEPANGSWKQVAHRLIERLSDRSYTIEDLESKLAEKHEVIEGKNLTIDHLINLIEDCEREKRVLKDTEKHEVIEGKNLTIDHLINLVEDRERETRVLKDALKLDAADIGGLEAELSEHKKDSEVLGNVVHVVELWDTPPTCVDICRVRALLENYLDAPKELPNPSTHSGEYHVAPDNVSCTVKMEIGCEQ